MRHTDFSPWPKLQGALEFIEHDFRSSGCFLERLLEARGLDGGDWGLSVVEDSLNTLLTRFNYLDLREQLGSLVGNEQKWDKAVTEILGLGLVASAGCLGSIGWPKGGAGSAPFDGEASVQGVLLPFDVKSASGSGLWWLRNLFQEVASDWGARHGYDQVNVKIEHCGTTSQQELCPQQNVLRSAFFDELSRHENLPVRWDVSYGSTSLVVTVIHKHDVTEDNGIQSVEALVASILPTFRDHIEYKSRQAIRCGGSPFLLVYVRPPGRGGSDFRGCILEPAFRQLQLNNIGIENKHLWLGSVFFDWTSSPTAPMRMGLLRDDASWPVKCGPTDFARALGITEWDNGGGRFGCGGRNEGAAP